jgi:crossover junction endodeoxyribonuclease RuvC
MIYVGIDPGAISGAIAALDHNSKFVNACYIENEAGRILPLSLVDRLSTFIDPKEGGEIAMEAVHAMPNQGASSTAKFMRAAGAIEAVAILTRYPVHFVSPQSWKKFFGLGRDKYDSLLLAREKWPDAGMHIRKKGDHNIAEALLIAEYLRIKING